MGKIFDLTGQRFGKLVVKERLGRIGANRDHSWLCVCDCENTFVTKTWLLRKGISNHCGCLTRSRQIKHGWCGTKEYVLWLAAKTRAKRDGIAFDITPGDVIIPKACPLLGLVFDLNKRGCGPADNSPSLDRIDSSKGYIKGNIWVISYRANVLKSDGTLEEHELLVQNWKRLARMGIGVSNALADGTGEPY